MTCFLIAFFLSMIGSLPFGMINMAVAHTAIRNGVAAGIWMGLGASLVELFQVFIALKFTELFTDGGWWSLVLHIIAIIVFFAAGIYFFFFAKTKPAPVVEKTVGRKRKSFVKGIFISSVNVMVIPYWIFYGTLLIQEEWLVPDTVNMILFSCGAMGGAFALLIAYAFLGDRILRKSEQITKYVNKFIGLVLIGLGIWQVIKFL